MSEPDPPEPPSLEYQTPAKYRPMGSYRPPPPRALRPVEGPLRPEPRRPGFLVEAVIGFLVYVLGWAVAYVICDVNDLGMATGAMGVVVLVSVTTAVANWVWHWYGFGVGVFLGVGLTCLIGIGYFFQALGRLH